MIESFREDSGQAPAREPPDFDGPRPPDAEPVLERDERARHRNRPVRQSPVPAVPRGTTMETSPMPPSLSGRMRTVATIWLAWTAAGLFYVTQDFVPRLYRNESVPWQGVFVGWM